MYRDRGRKKWAAVFIIAFLTLVGVGIGVGLMGYNMGMAQGLAIGAHAAPVEQDARVAAQHYGYYGWHPWGFGFGGFGFFVPFLFFAFWFLLLRRLFWAAAWRRHGFGYGYGGYGAYGGGCGYGRGRYGYGRHGGWGRDRYGDDPRDVPPGFEDWHRRAHDWHDRKGGDPSGPTAHL